jgi:hypothetical protein
MSACTSTTALTQRERPVARPLADSRASTTCSAIVAKPAQPMPKVGVGLAICAVVIATGQIATAQPVADPHPELAEARRYAPILWPNQLEEALPVLPHALAFNGRDDDGDSKVDLDDPEELAFGLSGVTPAMQLGICASEPAVDPKTVLECMRRIASPLPIRVLVDVSRQFEAKFKGEEREFDVYRYWYYYPYDRGPGFHLHDSEHSFAFVDLGQRPQPANVLAQPSQRDSSLSTSVRALVGAGHDSSTANNIVVSSRDGLYMNHIMPMRLPLHPGVLIELGKHASAPDLDLNGRFDLGVDANLFRDSVWGSRDSVASTFGQLNAGSFQPWQSQPRDLRDSVPEVTFVATDDASYAYYRSRLGAAGVEPSTLRTYSLFPMIDMQTLYDRITEGREAAQRFLSDHRQCFWGQGAPTSVHLSLEAWEVMRQWPFAKDAQRMPWRHDDHHDAGVVFRQYLFPDIAAGAGVRIEHDSRPALRVAMQFSDIRLPHWVPVLGGARLFNGSSADVSLLFARANRPARLGFVDSSAVTLKRYRGSRGGPYLGAAARFDRLQGAQDKSGEQLDDIAGLIGIERQRLDTHPRKSRVRFGIRTGWGVTLHFTEMWLEAQFGVIAEGGGGAADDLNRAFGARSNFRVEINAQVFRRVSNPRHPLTY